jgi:hypothetical protein
MVPVNGKDMPWPDPHTLVAMYNHATPDNVPAAETIEDTRLKKLKRALRSRPLHAWWAEVFRQYHASRFLSGRTPPRPGHESFQPDLDWLLSNGKDGTWNAVKVHDGKYRDG